MSPQYHISCKTGIKDSPALKDSILLLEKFKDIIPPTLLAMGLEPSIAKSALRMTFRTPLTREQVERISLAIEESYTDLTRY